MNVRIGLLLTVTVTQVVFAVRAGQDLNANAAAATPAASCPGDFDGNGNVNLADFLAFAGAFGARSGDSSYNALMDLDASGAVDLSDFLAFASVFGTVCPVQESPPVSIPDANLRAVIEDSLGKASDAPITRAEMATLTRLDAPNSAIKDLTGLNSATGLMYLDLGDEYVSSDGFVNSNSISDLSPLTGLSNLTWLELGYNSITDVSSLSVLANLTHLDVSFNSITDVSPLTKLTNLATLHLSGNSFRDISPLSTLTNLTRLELIATYVSDVSALSSLTKLEVLDLLGNRITEVRISDISALSSLTNLKWLRLSRHDKITDFSVLSSMRSLETLYLAETSVTDLLWISSLTALRSLSLFNNKISDVPPLSGLTNLVWLNLNRNSVMDVSALSVLTNLQTLFLSNNRIRDLSPLSANTGLGSGDRVYVRGNPLNAASLNVHVPALQARGVTVSFDDIVVFDNPEIYNDNVFVLPVAENLAAGRLPLDEYATRFYGHFSDAFDFLIFFPSLSREQLDTEAFKGAFYAGVGNDVKGLGLTSFYRDNWGSAGKMQGGVFFAHVSGRSPDHSRLVEGPMLHELMHRWANFIVGRSIPHWDFTSANGILGGFDIANLVDQGGGRYRAPNVYTGGWAANTKPYSPIELYLAGLIPPDEVPDLWVAEDGETLRNEAGGWDRRSFTASRVKTYTIDDFITEHGPRVPDHTQSQKAFRAAVVLLVSEDYPATRKYLETLSSDAALFSHAGDDHHDDWYNFHEATGGRATITMGGLSQLRSTGGAKRPVARSFGTPPPPIVCHPH